MDPEEAVKKVREELEKEIDVKEVYLFGSRAKGDFRKFSDYDFAVVSEDFENMKFGDRQQIVRPTIRKALGDVALDVATYTPEEFERGKEGFLPEIIIEEGIKG